MHERSGSDVADSAVFADGPWTHRDVSAGGARFHAVEAGSGPLVLLLHGFPEFWWAWRNQIPVLADAGLRVVAPDLRGYGASDKPPRGYDAFTLASDVAGMVRALGERDAMLVGHGIGGLVAWTTAVLHRPVVRRLAVVSAPHPLPLRRQLAHHVRGHARGQLRASWHVAVAQIPRAESYLRRHDGEPVAALLRAWAAPGWPDEETEARMRAAFVLGNTPHCALEYYRWGIRSLIRPDGIRYARSMARPVTAPTLQLHGAMDRCILPATAEASDRHVKADYCWRLLDGVGHFPHEEDPKAVTEELLRWARADQP